MTGATALLLGVAAVGAVGCGSDGAGDGGPVITLGFQGPLSGESQQLGINGLNGVKTAIERPTPTRTCRSPSALVESDDQGARRRPDRRAEAHRQPRRRRRHRSDLLRRDEGERAAVHPASLLSVSPSATNPTLTDLGFETFYRVITPDTVQGAAAAEYVVKVAAGQARSSRSTTAREYGIGLSGTSRRGSQAQGVEFVHDGINPTKDYTSEATKIVAENPDLLYYSGYYAEFALLTKALRNKNFPGNTHER